MTNKPLREEMGARGRPKAIKYDWANIAQRVLDYYQKTIDGTATQKAIPKAETPSVRAASGKH